MKLPLSEKVLALEPKVSLCQVQHHVPFRIIETIHLAYKTALQYDKIIQISSMEVQRPCLNICMALPEYQIKRLKEKLDKVELVTACVDIFADCCNYRNKNKEF